VEVDTLEELDGRIAAGARRLDGWRVSGVDLTAREAVLAECTVHEALFLGCETGPALESRLRGGGAIVMHEVPDTPIDPYRVGLYSPADLYDTRDYAASFDARAYAWSQGRHDARSDQDRALAQALHDHSVDRALATWVADRSLVGVMGGHALRRGSEEYAAAARLGHALASRHTVATGGGPGAMEASNLGAFLSARPLPELDNALAQVGSVPSFVPDVGAWADVALEVVDALGDDGVESLGVPTWHYGHEPPNPFATVIAKYFANATREAVLLQLCDAGIVFLPGAGGTVQEVFQDACENYYADPSSVAPMVLVGVEHWTRTVPAWPLLEALAKGRPMEEHVHLVDTVDEAAAIIG
jgi:predicted Rossmann-fold nucleotide-binding protein